jgi:regulator of chromosome condensation
MVEIGDGVASKKITKLAAGGYTMTALDEEGNLWAWADRPPHLLPIDFGEELGGEPQVVGPLGEHFVGIVDVGVGQGHVILLTEEKDVFVAGDNDNGQLGLGRDSGRSPFAYTELNLAPNQEVVGVAAGPRSSFIITQKPS